MKVMTDERIAELRRLEAAATKGPWKVDSTNLYHRICSDQKWAEIATLIIPFPSTLGQIKAGKQAGVVAAFIVAMRNALPELLAMLDELRKKNRAINAEHVRQELSWNAKLANAEAALREIRVEVPSERYGRNHADMDGLVVRLRKIDEIARVALAEKEKS